MSGEHKQCGHSHAPSSFGRAFLIGIILNTGFIIAEVIYGIYSNSLALLADAGHNASDVLALLLAWGAVYLSGRKPTARYTYGLKSSTILAALVNAVTLLAAIGYITYEAVGRLLTPAIVESKTVIYVALLGFLINGFTAYMFMRGRKHDLNIRGAYLHMFADAAISLGVAVAGVFILFTGWNWLDPAISLLIVVVIFIGTWALLRDSVNLALMAVPAGMDAGKVNGYLLAQPGVKAVLKLHIWAVSTNENALVAHLLVPSGADDQFLAELAHGLERDFNIANATIQVMRKAG